MYCVLCIQYKQTEKYHQYPNLTTAMCSCSHLDFVCQLDIEFYNMKFCYLSAFIIGLVVRQTFRRWAPSWHSYLMKITKINNKIKRGKNGETFHIFFCNDKFSNWIFLKKKTTLYFIAKLLIFGFMIKITVFPAIIDRK